MPRPLRPAEAGVGRWLQAPAMAARLAGRPVALADHRRGLEAAALAGLALAAGLASLAAYATGRIRVAGRRDDRRPTDAIVVLGAAQYDGRPSRVLAARLDHAIELYREGCAPYLIVTGGKLPADRTTEAATERGYALARGIPASAILAEDSGRTTLESLAGVRDLLADRGLSSALFVSDRTHMLRVLQIAADQGIVARGSPTAASPADRERGLRFQSVVHELGALALYLLLERPRPPLARLPATADPAVALRSPAAAHGPAAVWTSAESVPPLCGSGADELGAGPGAAEPGGSRPAGEAAPVAPPHRLNPVTRARRDLLRSIRARSTTNR